MLNERVFQFLPCFSSLGGALVGLVSGCRQIQLSQMAVIALNRRFVTEGLLAGSVL